jgi:hypothetical protein
MEYILNLNFYSSDLREDITIRGFMQKLLLTLFEEMDGFSGKRPFGNSGWDGDLIVCLINNGWLEGKVDKEGYLDNYNYDQYSILISNLIKSL